MKQSKSVDKVEKDCQNHDTKNDNIDDGPDDDADADDNDDANATTLPLLSSLTNTNAKNKGSRKNNRKKDFSRRDGSIYHDFTATNDPHDYDCDQGCPNDVVDADDDYETNYLQNHKHISPVHQIMHTLQSQCQRICPCFHFLPLRILLLAFYLAFTLSSFWILDSIKEPTLALLVNGDLGKHQPRAKMLSFVVVVALAVGMEWVDRVRLQSRKKRRRVQLEQLSEGGRERNHQQQQQQRRAVDGQEGKLENFMPLEELEANAALEKSWQDRDLPMSMIDSSSKLKRMGVRIGQHFHWRSKLSHGDYSDDNDTGESSSKITTLAFYVVGSLYIHGFVTVAIALRQHPAFRPGGMNDANATNNTTDSSTSTNEWYYPALGYTLFALIESFGSVSITIFWAFANSHLTLEAAERHYGSIVAVAQAGAIAGSTLSAVLGSRRSKSNILSDEELLANDNLELDVSIMEGVEESDAQVTPMLIFMACGCIGAGMAIMALYSQLFSKPMRQHSDVVVRAKQTSSGSTAGKERDMSEEEQVNSLVRLIQHDEHESNTNGILTDLFGGVHLIFRHEYLKLVLAVSVLYEITLTCMHYEMNLIGLDRFGVGISIVDESEIRGDSETDHPEEAKEEITYIQFMGWYGQTVNVLSLFLSFYAFPRLIKNYGLRKTIRIFPTFLLVVTLLAFVLFPRNLYFLFVALSLCKAMTYSVHDPAEEVLYMPTSDAVKFRAKFWIDVVGQRVAKAVGSAVNNYAGSVEGIVMYGSVPSVVASLALWLACYQVGILFDGLIKSGDVVGLEEEHTDEGMLEMVEDVDNGEESEGNNDAYNRDGDHNESPLFRDPQEELCPPSFGVGKV